MPGLQDGARVYSDVGEDVRRGWETRFRAWAERVDRMHQGFHFVANSDVPWTPLPSSLSALTVALVTTSGIHRRTDPPFDLRNPDGDPTWRLIAGDTITSDLMASHAHYDTDDANRDANVVFPLDALRALEVTGEVGRVASAHVGMMGFMPNGTRMRDEVGPHVAEVLRQAGVQAAVLTPG